MRLRQVLLLVGAISVACLAWALARADGGREADRLELSELGHPLSSTIRFEESAGELRPLPETAPVYRVTREGMPKAEAEALAEACGIHSGVRKGDVDAGHLFVAGDERHQLRVYSEPGCAGFADYSRLWIVDQPNIAPDQDRALEEARLFLGDVGRALTGDVRVSAIGPKAFRSHRSETGEILREPVGFSVGFRRRLSGYEVMGYGHTSVEFGYDGKPAGFSQVWRPVAKESDVALIGVKAALSRLRDVQAGFRGLQGYAGTASVESVRLIYWERSPTVRQSFLEPVYEFSGTLTPDAGGAPVPFTARVPAVD